MWYIYKKVIYLPPILCPPGYFCKPAGATCSSIIQ